MGGGLVSRSLRCTTNIGTFGCRPWISPSSRRTTTASGSTGVVGTSPDISERCPSTTSQSIDGARLVVARCRRGRPVRRIRISRDAGATESGKLRSEPIRSTGQAHRGDRCGSTASCSYWIRIERAAGHRRRLGSTASGRFLVGQQRSSGRDDGWVEVDDGTSPTIRCIVGGRSSP